MKEKKKVNILLLGFSHIVFLNYTYGSSIRTRTVVNSQVIYDRRQVPKTYTYHSQPFEKGISRSTVYKIQNTWYVRNSVGEL